MSNPSSSSTTTTITTAKSTFLRSQIRLLSSPLHLSSQQQQQQQEEKEEGEGEEPTIPRKTLDDVLAKVDAKVKSHNRLVFSVQSQRHVAEQIDALYWAEIDEARRKPGGEEGEQEQGTAVVYVPRDTDLSETGGIVVLSGGDDDRGLREIMVVRNDDDDDDDGNEEGRGEEAEKARERRYRELREQLASKAKRRDELRAKVGGYRGLRKVLAAFEEVRVGVQPNLVAKGGELEVELERLKVLVARVVAGMAKGGVGVDVAQGEGQVEQDVVVSERQRLQRVMDLD